MSFFFILSGFVLTWSTRPTVTVADFYVRRFARVYPNHFVMMLVALVVPVTTFPITPAGVATNATLTQSWFPQWPISFGLNGVSWSLSCEFFFYACTPFILRAVRDRSDRTAALLLGGWFVLMAGVALTMGLHSNALDIYAYTLPIVRSGEFTLGVLLGLLATRGTLPRIPQWVALGVLGVTWFLTLTAPLPQSVGDVVFSIPFALVIAAAATADLADKPGLMRNRLLIYGGQVSFAFYLVHELVLINGELLWGAGPTGTALRVGLYAIVFGVVALLSIALHEGVEKPAQRAIRNAFRSRVRGKAA